MTKERFIALPLLERKKLTKAWNARKKRMLAKWDEEHPGEPLPGLVAQGWLDEWLEKQV